MASTIATKVRERILRRLERTPPRYYTAHAANRAGLQVARTLYHESAWRLRRRRPASPRVASWLDALRRDGYLVVEDFLEAAVFDALAADFRPDEFDWAPDPEGPGASQGASVRSTPTRCDDPVVRRAFAENRQLRELIEAATGRRIRVFPKVTYSRHRVSASGLEGPDPQETAILHYDVPIHALRCFVYVNESSAANAAFTYAPGTHRLSRDRLALEHRDSVAQTAPANGGQLQHIQTDLLDRVAAEPRSINGGPNTLVVFDTMGLHRRGSFLEPGHRDVAIIDFRALESPLNRLLAVPAAARLLQHDD